MIYKILRALAIAAWLAAAIFVYSIWAETVALLRKLIPGVPGKLIIVPLLLLIMLGAALQIKLLDLVDERKRMERQMRARARKEGEAASKSGQPGEALSIYEAAGMWAMALKVAEDLGDKPSLVRIYTRMARHAEASQVQAEMGDYEG